MPPKNKFSKEQIIDVAFEIAKEEGIENITIRKIAAKLGSSIAPIYVNFNDVEELKENVLAKIYEISNRMLLEQDTGDIFLNIGTASVQFAREYHIIFRELMLKSNHYLDDYNEQLGNNIIELMKQDKSLKDLTDAELNLILLKMRIFQVGLSIMATNEPFINQFTQDKIIELLRETGADMIKGALERQNNWGG